MIDYALIGSILVALAVGGGLAWFAAKTDCSARVASRTADLTAQLVAKQARAEELELSQRTNQGEIARLQEELMARTADLAGAQASLAAANSHGDEKVALVRSARQELSDQFRVIAAEIMEEKTKGFVELNQATLTKLLTPLQGELTGFREKVEEVHRADIAGRSALEAHVKSLSDLNHKVRDETINLTRALKGDAKVQGNWGEVVLDGLLESAGLMEGEHYTRQESRRDEDGKRAVPDVIINLPNDSHLVVDSKVTLTAYSELTAATTDEARAVALKAHIDAVRRHIKGLSDKKYQALYDLKSMDFVVMFMPLEGAFMAAVTSDQNLFEYAWERNVILVSPSTLLFVVRTVAHVWGQEKQRKNYLDIAKRGELLYDKFVGFGEDLLKVGEHLSKARESFDDARSKLSEGSGNLVKQAQQLVKLGVRANKAMPAALSASLDESLDDPVDSPPLIAAVGGTTQPS